MKLEIRKDQKKYYTIAAVMLFFVFITITITTSLAILFSQGTASTGKQTLNCENFAPENYKLKYKKEQEEIQPNPDSPQSEAPETINTSATTTKPEILPLPLNSQKSVSFHTTDLTGQEDPLKPATPTESNTGIAQDENSNPIDKSEARNFTISPTNTNKSGIIFFSDFNPDPLPSETNFEAPKTDHTSVTRNKPETLSTNSIPRPETNIKATEINHTSAVTTDTKTSSTNSRTPPFKASEFLRQKSQLKATAPTESNASFNEDKDANPIAIATKSNCTTLPASARPSGPLSSSDLLGQKSRLKSTKMSKSTENIGRDISPNPIGVTTANNYVTLSANTRPPGSINPLDLLSQKGKLRSTTRKEAKGNNGKNSGNITPAADGRTTPKKTVHSPSQQILERRKIIEGSDKKIESEPEMDQNDFFSVPKSKNVQEPVILTTDAAATNATNLPTNTNASQPLKASDLLSQMNRLKSTTTRKGSNENNGRSNDDKTPHPIGTAATRNASSTSPVNSKTPGSFNLSDILSRKNQLKATPNTISNEDNCRTSADKNPTKDSFTNTLSPEFLESQKNRVRPTLTKPNMGISKVCSDKIQDPMQKINPSDLLDEKTVEKFIALNLKQGLGRNSLKPDIDTDTESDDFNEWGQ